MSQKSSTATLLRLGFGLVFAVCAVIVNRIADGIQPTDESCVRKTSSWSPAREAISYAWQTFPNSFDQPSKFRGTPTPQLEQAWAEVAQDYQLIMPAEVVDAAFGGRSGFAHASVNGRDGVLGGLEVFGQLECLNFLRQFTYKDEYDYSHEPAFQLSEDEQFTKVDACLQRLRQQFMCAADMTPYLIVLKPHEGPDFETLHYCRDFGRIHDWAKTHADGGYNYRLGAGM